MSTQTIKLSKVANNSTALAGCRERLPDTNQRLLGYIRAFEEECGLYPDVVPTMNIVDDVLSSSVLVPSYKQTYVGNIGEAKMIIELRKVHFLLVNLGRDARKIKTMASRTLMTQVRTFIMINTSSS